VFAQEEGKMSIESPKYTLLKQDGKFEIRDYQPYINASVEIVADFNDALNGGFNILAGYIFGNNRAKTRINMTAPVTEQAVKGQKIAMTAPVTAAKLGDGATHLVSFTMPSKYTLDSLPEPVNDAIKISAVAAHKAAVVKFSGYLNEKTVLNKTQALAAWLKQNNLQAKPGFISAQYNPPFIPGFMRRNEIITELV
jgi:hypothetical protein